jgi:hypothetical protein
MWTCITYGTGNLNSYDPAQLSGGGGEGGVVELRKSHMEHM